MRRHKYIIYFYVFFYLYTHIIKSNKIYRKHKCSKVIKKLYVNKELKMKSNVQYNGLKDYYKKECKVKLKWINIILISTIIILYIVNIKLKYNSFNTIKGLKESVISKEIKQENIVQENIEKEKM